MTSDLMEEKVCHDNLFLNLFTHGKKKRNVERLSWQSCLRADTQSHEQREDNKIRH